MTKIDQSESGLGAIAIFCVVGALAIVVGVGYVVASNRRESKNEAASSANVERSNVDVEENVPPVSTEPLEKYPGSVQYKNNQYDISFYYPEEWRVNEVKITEDSAGPAPIEFTIGLKTLKQEKYDDTALIDVYAKNFDPITAFFEDAAKQVPKRVLEKKSDVVDGKRVLAIKSSISSSSNRVEEYYYEKGSKTYGLRSINEQLNVQRDSAYWDKFSTIHDSIEL